MTDLTTLGNRHIYKQEFKGKEYIHIREYYATEDGEMAPTKKGTTFLPEQLDDLIAALEKLK